MGLAFVLAGALLSSASAQPVTGGLPKAFADYVQHDITPGLCHVVSAAEAQCVIPEMTAGQYAIEAAGTSTSQGADAKQTLEIRIGSAGCATGQNSTPWPSGARTFRLGCATTILTDRALIVHVIYGDVDAIKDPKGPLISIRRLPWQGILSVSAYVPKQ